MESTDIRYRTYLKILEEELVPAMGCTEPIALAYAAAKAREVLGGLPERVEIGASGSIIKNVKSVIVPNTGKLKGMEAAAAVGIVAGVADRELEVISAVSDEERRKLNEYLDDVEILVKHIDTGHVFDLYVTTAAEAHSATVRITDHHTNIVRIEKDGVVLFERETEEAEGGAEERADRGLLNMKDIWDFAMTVDTADVRGLLDRQIRFNTEIAEEGLAGHYGADIGRIRLATYGTDIKNRASAKAAAGSDARMGGCELPVIINSGSGNQGITCSVPVIEYAKELGCETEKLYRALVLSNLVSIHEKTGIGTLSAYCGAVS
ncbi:MAG: serine dehydratase subunit alpha family protein, partial [Firmicutes bacterium]|nr:serine dehydratase subunit alpha family protein [Bacillota bacterium]